MALNKSTLFNCITGDLPRRSQGELFCPAVTNQSSGRPNFTDRASPAASNGADYPQLSVFSNLLIAIQEHQERSVLGRILRTGQDPTSRGGGDGAR